MNQFFDEKKNVEAFCANLIARQYLHKKECKELNDEGFRGQVERHLASVGMQLIDNIYSEYYVIGLRREHEHVLEDQKTGDYYSNNLRLKKGAMALLTLVWCLLILPKRERQTEGKERRPDQMDILPEFNKRPIPKNVDVYLEEDKFRIDFKHLFPNKGDMTRYLNDLTRLGFIKRKDNRITEAPLLDTLIDYSEMVDNIKEGLLQELPEMINVNSVRTEVVGQQEELDEEKENVSL